MYCNVLESCHTCNIPDPPTSEEDATMALTIRATAPWTCTFIEKLKCWNKMLWTRTCIHDYLSYSESKHTFIQAFHMFIIIINSKYDCRSKIDKITYLIKNSFRNKLRRCNVPPNHRPACSLISQQSYHPRVGHDSPRNKEQAWLHIAKDTQNTAKPTQLGLSGHQQDSQAKMIKFIKPSRS